MKVVRLKSNLNGPVDLIFLNLVQLVSWKKDDVCSRKWVLVDLANMQQIVQGYQVNSPYCWRGMLTRATVLENHWALKRANQSSSHVKILLVFSWRLFIGQFVVGDVDQSETATSPSQRLPDGTSMVIIVLV